MTDESQNNKEDTAIGRQRLGKHSPSSTVTLEAMNELFGVIAEVTY
jgi:hypothetical protein